MCVCSRSIIKQSKLLLLLSSTNSFAFNRANNFDSLLHHQNGTSALCVGASRTKNRDRDLAGVVDSFLVLSH